MNNIQKLPWVKMLALTVLIVYTISCSFGNDNNESIANSTIDSTAISTTVIDSLEPEVPQKDTITIAAVGDIMMGTNFPSKNYLPPDSGNKLWAEAGPVLRSSNVTFGNLEGVILSEGGEMKECQNPKNCYLFRTPEDLSFQFKNNGFNYFC